MNFLLYAGIIIAVLIGAFIIELLIVGLYPWVTVEKQPLIKKGRLPVQAASGFSERKDVTFNVKNTTVSAWLYLPRMMTSPVPCIVMAQGLGGTKNMLLDSYAVRFRDQGFAVLAFDYRFLGESGGEPRQLIWIPSQLEDYAAAIEYVRGVKEIDPERIALWGTSLSGGHVAAIAAKDNRIACISAQCPLLDGAAAFEQHSHSISIKYMFRMAGHAQRDIVRSWLGLSPHKIPIVGKPGTIAHMADMDAWNVFEESAPDDFVNECCARIGIRLDKYRPIKNLDRVRCPVLIQVCDKDATLPPGVVQKASDKLGKMAEIRHYPISHFDIYRGEYFQKAVNDQIAFFKQHLALTEET